MLNNFYNIWHTLYRVNLQHNSYWFVHLTYVLLLHYLAKEVGCRNYNFTQKVTLFDVQTNKHPVYSHSQSALNSQYYSKCSKCSFSFTQVWSLWHHSSTASSTMLCDKCQSSAVSDRPLLKLVCDTRDHASHHIPYSLVNSVKIMAIGRPWVWRNEFWSFMPQELDRMMCTVS